ncbi:glycogen debranching protein GlgX [Haliangium ochraceum]|uniref:Glycogen debranching enzyme GlgX n=1 Tax=Haliangium ochraceum (strain DSM 14365 / JCM 11303 / SMP-2) TaxID=502025 RepID=D0LNN1_HALO1|nr:glycogen debranching protein GlgX [Haliangium ochraceum]ACY16936.1 glycogen debranching enzyme GlgX [Haliangium ochraceum DSM 14365]
MYDLDRIDSHATHNFGDYQLRAGRPLPFGATRVPGGINFSIFSRHATACTLVLYEKHAAAPMVEIPFPDTFRIGNVFSMVVFGLDFENIEYGFRMDGPHDPRAGHRFDPSVVLLDPYAKAIGGRDVWAQGSLAGEEYPYRGRIVFDDFDWEDDRPPEIPIEDLVIYEMHVRGFTKHDSSSVKHPGTFAAIREKVPYLKSLGVNCIELMPICEFDELDNHHINPETGDHLKNYWGYSTIGFFAPKAGYAATGHLSMQVDELKTLIKFLHASGIEVILDVVFNHTAEGDSRGQTLSYRGIDNQTYYMLTPEGDYQNFSGVGNTLNCNNPIVRYHVLDCLRYWASEYHIDGFRFDLASILGRDAMGVPLENPPLLEALAYDPILAKCKLIAEAWDAGGLYQVGRFPDYNRWAEWNGHYRDITRRFLKGDAGVASAMARCLEGSPDLYARRGPTASVNFITAHDGFTLADMVSYNHKHNWANGEQERDGHNGNLSWNCGVEGPSDDREVLRLRERQMRNAIALLMVSQGVPMILMGDEVGRSRKGNNNPYCHDGPLTWFDWSLTEQNAHLLRFFRCMIGFRHAHPILRQARYFTGEDVVGSGFPDLSWHGVRAWTPDHGGASRTLAFMLCGRHAPGERAREELIYVAVNSHWEAHEFELPHLPPELSWHRFLDTSVVAPHEIAEPGAELRLASQTHKQVGARSLLILVGRRPSPDQGAPAGEGEGGV